MTFATAEEAFFDALRFAPKGESFDFVIHQDHCLLGSEDIELCICTPQTVHHKHEADDCGSEEEGE